MFERLKAIFDTHPPLATDGKGGATDDELRIATVVLLLEVAYGDQELLRKEQRAILRGIEREFGLSREQALELAARAEAVRPPAATLRDLTDAVRSGFGVEQRTRVLAWIWKIIDADDVATDWEQVFAEYVSDRLWLSAPQAERARAMARRGEV